MPSVSLKQHHFIEYLRHNPSARAGTGFSQKQLDEWSHADKGSPWKHADGGGITDYGAPPIEPSLQTASPLMQGMIQRYSSLPTERLRELSVMMGQSPQGQVIGRLLQQRNMMPQQDTAIAQQPQVGMGRGGVPGRQMGGGWEERAAYREAEAPAQAGLLMGPSMGRADKVQTSAPGGSYVVPAEVISGIGEGNSLAGARMMQSMLSSGPWGTPMPRMGGRNTIPRAPALPRDDGGSVPLFDARAAGGVATNRPVDLSHGEFVITPQQVTQIGGGDWVTGKRILDRWVVSEHRKHAKKLATIAGPVGMRE